MGITLPPKMKLPLLLWITLGICLVLMSWPKLHPFRSATGVLKKKRKKKECCVPALSSIRTDVCTSFCAFLVDMQQHWLISDKQPTKVVEGFEYLWYLTVTLTVYHVSPGCRSPWLWSSEGWWGLRKRVCQVVVVIDRYCNRGRWVEWFCKGTIFLKYSKIIIISIYIYIYNII